MLTEPLSTLQSTLPDDGWRRLETFLGSVDAGNKENLVTPFFPKEWRSDPRGYATWYAENIAHSKYEEFNQAEMDEVELFGPMSIRLPWKDRREGILEYFQRSRVVTDVTYLERGFRRLSRWIRNHTLRPLSFESAYEQMPKDSNQGLPWFSKSKKYHRSYLKRAIANRQSGYSSDLYPCVIGWRGQSNGDLEFPKQRGVFMADHQETIIGLSVQVPVLEALRSRPEFAAWNRLDRVDQVVTSVIDKAKVPIWSADFSGFDKRLPREVIHYAFDLLRLWFVKSAEAQLDWLERQILTVSLVTPEGVWTGRQDNMPSGSALTNLVDSLCQLLMIYGLLPENTVGSVLGDDGFYLSPAGINVAEMSSLLDQLYGARVSADKGGFSKDAVKYLQRLHLNNYRMHGLCVGVRMLTRTWNSICYQERAHPELPPEWYSAAAISKLENSKWHPRFRSAVEYFFTLDKFSQDLDPSVIFKRAGGVRTVETSLNYDSFKFGKELPSRGLNEFATVKLLREFRSRRKPGRLS